jgi:hypothetical protein
VDLDVIAREEAQKRQDAFQQRRKDLALERLSLTRKTEDIDKELAALDMAIGVNSLALKDMDTEAAIAAAKAAEEVADNKETQDD